MCACVRVCARVCVLFPGHVRVHVVVCRSAYFVLQGISLPFRSDNSRLWRKCVSDLFPWGV